MRQAFVPVQNQSKVLKYLEKKKKNSPFKSMVFLLCLKLSWSKKIGYFQGGIYRSTSLSSFNLNQIIYAVCQQFPDAVKK